MEGPKNLSPDDLEKIREAIRSKYRDVSLSAAGKFQYPTGREGAEQLGYDPAVIAAAPVGMLTSFCGVGNPFSLGDIKKGEYVLDFGCGAGFDMYVAARLVGKDGLVCGVDLTEAMVIRAKKNLQKEEINHVEIQLVNGESIPWQSSFFDVVISNGVINLSPGKEKCFAEIHRVLKPGGRIQFADVVLEKALPKHLTGSVEAWSQ
ncbi:MAG: methyltransferase domain-containing protein [Pseudomonadota bacterium]